MHFFPEAGFDQSAVTPVLLGVLVSWFFVETLGWVFAGLVVPGYLAALFVIHPRSGAIDVAEALITYAIARGLGEGLSRTGLTSRVFGRERFLLVLLVSVLVRLGVEALALPRMFGYARWAFSTGLVVVPLAANACWKTGLRRGLLQNGVPTLLVYLLLRYVLMPHTNLSLAGFNLATEDVAASFLASPKAYILLLTGAVLAAIGNIRYGWDYNGILIPALLALTVSNPIKLAATMLESLVLLGLVTWLQRATPLRSMNIEGPRRLTLFFTLDYALRFAFASAVGRRLPGADVVDLMGFGYLLPTLLAVKASQRGLAQLVLLPTVSVSLAAFALGSLVGFAALKLDARALAREPVARADVALPDEPLQAAALVAGLARPSAPRAAREAAAESARLLPAVGDAWRARRGAVMPSHVQAQRLRDGIVVLRERFESLEHRVGDPTVFLGTTARAGEGLVALVPSPLSSPETALLAVHWLELGLLDAVVVAGVEESSGEGLDAPTIVARGLADRSQALLRRAGAVVVLRAGEHATVRFGARGPIASRVERLLARVGAEVVPLGRDEVGTRAGEVALTLPRAAVLKALRPLAPAEQALAGPDLASALDAPGRNEVEPTPEQLLPLRRLVLDPLLREGGAHEPDAVTRIAAAAFGYRVLGPFRFSDGASGRALVAAAEPKPIALVVRPGRSARIVVAAPRAGGRAFTGLALQLADELSASALVLGVPDGAPGHAALDQALAAAGRAFAAEPASFVLVRPRAQAAVADEVALATWGGSDADALAARADGALGRMGLHTRRAELDVAERELAGRVVSGDAALVALEVPQNLWYARAGERELRADFPELAVTDSDCGELAVRLARDLGAAPLAPDDLLESGQRASFEHSVVARRELLRATESGVARAGLCRSIAATRLVVAGRGRHGLWLGVLPATDVDLDGRPRAIRVDSEAACARMIATGGACLVSAAR